MMYLKKLMGVVALLLSTQLMAVTDDPLDGLASMSLEELLNVEVTLVSRNEERAFTAASAIYVITQEDIRRSGLTTIPDLLRMVPGMHVSKLDSNKWAINSRGPNQRFSRNMLVLVDGRSVYTPLFAGVYWDVQDTVLPDIDHIEVIRGPGGSLWGANAVTGIINIITKDAADTQGGMVTVGYGEGDTQDLASVRYGFQTGDLSGRVYLKNRQSDKSEFLRADQSENVGFFEVKSQANDDNYLTQGGFRLDWEGESDHLTAQGDLYHGRSHDLLVRSGAAVANTADVEGANMLLRWSRDWSESSNLALQYYVDYTKRKDLTFKEERETHDLDFQHSFALTRQQITWGLGYRTTSDDTELEFLFELDPENRTYDTYSLFVQDQIEILADELFFTLGSKFEYNEFTHDEYQPSLRLRWSPNERHTLWAAYSRAVHTPSRSDSDARLNFNNLAFLCALGAPGFVFADDGQCVIPVGTETDPTNPINAKIFQVNSKEIGYRVAFDSVIIDVATFYDNFTQVSPNEIDKFYGVETDVRWQVSDAWQMAFSYTYHHGNLIDERTGDRNTVNGFSEHSANVRSYWDINHRWALDTQIYYRDQASGDDKHIPSNTRLYIRVCWQPMRKLEVSLAMTNLLDSVHPEGIENFRVTTGARRGAFLQAAYQF